MKRKSLLLLLLVATVAGVALAGSSIGRNADAGNRHILVAYFSATGNTKSVAETASTVLNADLLRILPAEPYTEEDLGHGADARVTREQSDPASRPTIKTQRRTGCSMTPSSSATPSGAARRRGSSTPL